MLHFPLLAVLVKSRDRLGAEWFKQAIPRDDMRWIDKGPMLLHKGAIAALRRSRLGGMNTGAGAGTMQIDELLATALAVSEAARPVPLGYFRRKLEVIAKADASPVTVADRETERVMREVLAAHVPEHGIFGEEHGRERLDHRFVWVLDPIDGTKSFITGFPLFNNLIAVLDDGRPVVGVVDTPAIGERYHAATGHGAWLNGNAVKTSGCTTLDSAAVYRAGHEPSDPAMRQRFERFATVGRVNRYGYDAYVYALLAAGHLDVMIESDLEPYDYLALVALVEEAGGVISDWSGRPLRLDSAGDVLAAATPALHAEALALLAR